MPQQSRITGRKSDGVSKKRSHHPLIGRKMTQCKLSDTLLVVACKVFGPLIRQLFLLLSSSHSLRKFLKCLWAAQNALGGPPLL